MILAVILTTLCSSFIRDTPAPDGYLATLRVEVQLPNALNDAQNQSTTTTFFSTLFVSPGTLSLASSKQLPLQLSDMEALVSATPVSPGSVQQTSLFAPVSTTSASDTGASTNVILLNALGDTPQNATMLVTNVYQAFTHKVENERSSVVNGLKTVLKTELAQSESDLANSTVALQYLNAPGEEFSSQYRYLNSLTSALQSRVNTINTLLITLGQQGLGSNNLLALSNNVPDVRTVPGAEITQSQRLALSSLERGQPTLIDAAQLTQSQRLALSPLVGLIMGLGGILLASRFSNTFPLQGKKRAMVLPHIPAVMPELPQLGSNRLQVLQEVAAPGLQILRELHYQADKRKRRLQLITVSSPKGREGKSTLATSLAFAAAWRGQHTLLVDANPRRPVLHTWFKLANTPGTLDTIRSLTSNMLGPSPLRLTALNLKLISIGSAKQKASANILPEPLPVDGLEPFMKLLRSQADLVIFDAPSLLTDASTANLVMLSDEVLLVVDAQKSQYTAVVEAQTLLSEMGVSFTTVLNRAIPEVMDDFVG